MDLRIVGAGLGRTGTNSLKVALEQLTEAPCYHMMELFGKPDVVAQWEQAAAGTPPSWDEVFAGYAATVDWPAAAFWRELAAANPHAPVLLSTRSSSEVWWSSMQQTVMQAVSQPAKHELQARTRAMVTTLLRERFCPEWPDRDAVIAAYERHNAEVRREVPADRLVEWRPGDGWQPLCDALGVAVPDEPFPHVNSTAEFREAMELGPAPGGSDGS